MILLLRGNNLLDELISFLSSEDSELKIRKKDITKIILVGLQGTGKTTSAAKIARFLKKEYKKNPILIGADCQRPAAKKQLEVLSDNNNIDFFTDKNSDSIKVISNGMKYAEKNGNLMIRILL